MQNSDSGKNCKIKQSKKWSIVIFSITIFCAFFIQSVLDSNINSETVQANMAQDKSTARETFKIYDLYNVINTSTDNHYIAIGETDKQVYSFAIQTFSEKLIFEELKLNLIGDINPDGIKKLQLFEGDKAISSTYTLKDGSFVFRNFKSILQENSYKEFFIKVDISDKAGAGSRFKFEIASPYDLAIKKDNQNIYALDTYPLGGSYTTVVGWKK